MPRSYLLGSRVRLLLIAAVAALLVLALLLHDASERRKWQIEGVQQDAMWSAQFASAVMNHEVEEAHALLITLANLHLTYRSDPRTCSKFLANLRAQYTSYANIGVVLPDGEVVCSSVPLKGRVNLGDRPWFRRVLETGAFSVGEYQMGRITGKPTLNFAYPILDRAGRIEAVVALVLDLDRFNQFAQKIQLPPGATLAVIDCNGVVLVFSPDPVNWVGKSFLDRPVVKTVLAQREGMSEMEGLDGVPSLNAFTPLTGGKENTLYVIVAIPKDIALTGVRRNLRRNLGELALVAVLLVLAAWGGSSALVLHRAGVLVELAKRLAAGDLGARSGISSYGHSGLDQLARSVDEMAVALEQRETERNKAEQALQQSKSFLEAILDGIRDSVCVIDVRDFRILGANRAFLDAYGLKMEDVIGKTCHGVTHNRVTPCLAPDDLCPLMEAITTGKHSVAEHVHRRSDGTEYYTEVSASPIEYSPDGRIVTVVHVSRGITERKRAEQEREYLIAKLQKALSEVKTLRGIVPICASCKKIRGDEGYWHQVEVYVRDHSEAEFSHGMCPECMRKLYPEFVDEE